MEFGGNGSIPFPLNAVTADQVIITGPAYLRSYSVRDTQNNSPVQANGSTVAPAAGATIATTAALPGGTYAVSWTVGLLGAAAAADANNFQLLVGATVIEPSLNPGAAGDYPQLAVEVTVPAGTAVLVKAIGAGTAGVTYLAELEVSPSGEIETIAELLDGSRPVAEISFRNEYTASADYGKPGICIETQLNIHMIQGTITGSVHVSYDRD